MIHYDKKFAEINALDLRASDTHELADLLVLRREVCYEKRLFRDTTSEAQSVNDAYDEVIRNIDQSIYMIKTQNPSLQSPITQTEFEVTDIITEHYPEHFYGIAYKILQGVKVENQFINPNDKKAIIKFGVEKYQLKTKGRSFYNGWKEFDLLNTPRYIESFPKYRHKWKAIVLNITQNNNDVALWLRKQND